MNAVALMIRKGGAGTALRDLAGVLIRGTVGGESLAHRGPRHSERDAEQTYRGGEHGYRDTATFAAFVVQLLVQKSQMQRSARVRIQGLRYFRGRAVARDHGIHIEKLDGGLRVRGGEMLAFACLVHKPTRSAQPAEVVIRSLDECRGVLASQEFADSAGTSERSARMWMRLKMKERFFVVGTHVSPQRIEATHQRTIWMHGAALVAEKYACSAFRLSQNQPCALIGPRGPKFTRS